MSRRTTLGLVVLLCAACGTEPAPTTNDDTVSEETESGTLMTTKTTDPRIPKIDLEVPETIETATFALG